MNHKNFAQTTLVSPIITTGGTAIYVNSSSSFPAVPFIVAIDTEAMLVTTVAGTTWTVERGYEGSTAATHANGATIYHNLSAAEADGIVVGGAKIIFNVRDYGAVGDGVTDDTAAIQAALTATPGGGILFFPNGYYLVTGSGTEIFLRTTPITIVGEGTNSFIMLNTTMGATTDLFRFKPASAGDVYNWRVSDIAISRKSGTVGRNAFTLDTGGVGRNLRGLIIEHVYCEYMLGYFVQTTATAYDGVFSSTIQDCYLLCGISLIGAGDSFRILNNIIGGPTEGVIADLVTQSGNLQIVGNSISTAKGCVVVLSCNSLVIANNIMEQQVTNTATNNCLIDLRGTTNRLNAPFIYGNSIGVPSSVGNPIPIRIDRVDNGSIFANNIGVPYGIYCITLTANPTKICISPGNAFSCTLGYSVSGGNATKLVSMGMGDLTMVGRIRACPIEVTDFDHGKSIEVEMPAADNIGRITTVDRTDGTPLALEVYAAKTSFMPNGDGSGGIHVGGNSSVKAGDLLVDNIVTATRFRFLALNTAPPSAAADGTLGDVLIASGYIYVCVAANTWKRVAIATW